MNDCRMCLNEELVQSMDEWQRMVIRRSLITSVVYNVIPEGEEGKWSAAFLHDAWHERVESLEMLFALAPDTADELLEDIPSLHRDWLAWLEDA